MSTRALEPERWLRGPVPDIPGLLQPVAHSLLQCRDEVRAVIHLLSPDALWRNVHGAASAGFHLRHATGSLDRLFTYARGEPLTDAQRTALAAEREPGDPPAGAECLVTAFEVAVGDALTQLSGTREEQLLDRREVGRARLPSTVLGLLFHAAEHTQRHVGQLVTTARFATGESNATLNSASGRDR